MSNQDKWVCRLLDTDEEVVPRICMVADYLRALRVLSHLRPELLQEWRTACITPDPLADGSAAVGQLRLFLDTVENQVGAIPPSVPMVDFVPNTDEAVVRQSRQDWATNVMAAILNIGSRSVVRDSVPQPEEEQDLAGPGHRVTLGTEISEGGGERPASLVADTGVSDGHLTVGVSGVQSAEVVVRKVQVLSGLRALGQCLVHLLPQDSGYSVFSQVCVFLSGFCQVPPLPRWIYVGETFDEGEHVDPRDPFASLVQETEIATIRCLEPDYGDGDTKLCEILEQKRFRVLQSTSALCLQVMRSHELLSEGDLGRFQQREVRIKSQLRDLGRVVVSIPPGSTPYTVFCQVVAFLGQEHSVPPLPRWCYVGDDLSTALALDLDARIEDQVLDNELLTIECLEQCFGLTRWDATGITEGRRKKRRRKHRSDTRAGGSSGGDQNTLGVPDPKRRRHGWDDDSAIDMDKPLQPLIGWDKPPASMEGLPGWVIELVSDMGVDLGPDKSEAAETTGSRAGLLQVGPLTGFSNIGQQAMIRLLNELGDIRNVTIHVKGPNEGENIYELALHGNEVSTFLRRLGGDLGLATVNFGSVCVGGWKLDLVDSFTVPTGHVVVARVILVKSPPNMLDSKKVLRPRTPSRSPPRKRDQSGRTGVVTGRRVFGYGDSTSGPQQKQSRDSGATHGKGRACQDGLHLEQPRGCSEKKGGLKDRSGDEGFYDIVEVSPTLPFVVETDTQEKVNGIGGKGPFDGIAQVDPLGNYHRNLNDFTVVNLDQPHGGKHGQFDGDDPGMGPVDRALLCAGVQQLSEQSERQISDLHHAFYQLLTKACGASVCFTKESKVAHFDIDSWVAVHEYYVLDLFPPPGVWFSSFSDVWVCSVFPAVPQELQKLQEQVRRWGPGTIGTDCRTNVFFQLVRIITDDAGLWLGQDDASGTLVYLQVHSDYLSWGPFEIGTRYVGFQVLQVGLLKNVPVVAIPGIGSGSSLIRRWHQALATTLPVVYELFAGIGGWHAGLQQLGVAQVIFIEISEVKARALAASLNIPCIRPEDLSPIFLERSCVLIADVRDASWYHVSLVAPPQVAVWSSPCVSWSRGGLARGLLSQDGVLLLDAASLVQVFGPTIDVGENVPGLLDHPDWEIIRCYLNFIGSEQFQVHFSLLSKLMPMSRGRIFLSRGLPVCELPVYKVAYPQDAWRLAEDEIQQYCLPTMDEKEMLGEVRFLPASVRRIAASYMTPRDLVALRVVESGVLPTLVASYRFQCELSVDHLLCKGIFTWMLPSAFGPRFIDAFEAAWIFGFGHTLVLPGFPKAAMRCIGNCVAPVQAAQVWWLVWQHLGLGCLAPSFEALLKAMVLGRPPLSCFRRIECCEQWYLGSQAGTCLPAQSNVLVVADGVLQPFQGEVGQRGEIFQERFIATAGNLVAQKSVETFEPVLDDLHVTVLARLRPVLVVLSRGTLRFSPLCSIRSMLQVLVKVCERSNCISCVRL